MILQAFKKGGKIMEVVISTPQRAGNHFPTLEEFLPSETLKALKAKFPSEHEVNKLFLESGGVIEYLGTSYSVQFEWRQDSDETIKALFILIHNGSEVTVTELIKNPDLHLYDFTINVLTPKAIPKKFSKTQISTQKQFEIIPLSKLMMFGQRVNTLAPTLKRNLPETFDALQKCTQLGLTKVQLVASYTSSSSVLTGGGGGGGGGGASKSSSSSSGPTRLVDLSRYASVPRKKPIPSSVKTIMRLAALILIGVGVYGVFRVAKWAFHHAREAKANTSFDWNRIKTGDLSQIDSRVVLISSLSLGFVLACSKKRALKVLGFATLAFGGTYYFKPELFQAAK